MKLLLMMRYIIQIFEQYYIQYISAKNIFIMENSDLNSSTNSNSNMRSLKCIRLSCAQAIQENEDNLFGERVYRRLEVNVAFNDESVEENYLRMGKLLCSTNGDPIMIFLGMTLLKDECSKLFFRGSYVRHKFICSSMRSKILLYY